MNPVRKADHADEETIFAVDRIAAIGDHDRLAMLKAAIESDRCLVFDVGGGVEGFVVTIAKGFLGRDIVALLVVDRARRRNGIGRRLLQTAVRSASTSRVFTSTNRSNAPMRALLESDGWSLSGELVGLDEGDPEFVYFMDQADC